MKKTLVVLESIRQDIIMVGIYCCLNKENYKVFKLPMNNFCYFEIRDSFFKPPSNKRRTSKPQNSNIFIINFKDSLIELGCPNSMFPKLI